MEFPIQATITHDIELNGNQSVSFSVLPTKVNKPFIDDISEMWEFVDIDEVVHKVIYAKKKGEGKLLNVEIKAIPLFYDTMDNSRIYEEYNEHMPAQRAFARIFEDMPFGFVLGGQFDAVEWEGFGGGETRLETFKRALERYKAEFKIVGDTVYLEHQVGRDTSFMYRYKLNASNIVKEIDAAGYWTYGVGYGDYGDGDGGEDWESAKLFREYTSPLAKIIGKRHAPPIKNGNITDRTTMYETIKTLVDESLKISVTTDIHDLRRQGYALAQPEVGDRVFIMDERIGLDEEVRVIDISVSKDWRGNILDLKLTIGSESLTKRHQSNMSTAVDAITDLIEGRRKLPFSVLDDAVKNATKALKDAQTELSFGTNGILAKDVNNPNLVTLLNSAGVGVSDDGGNTFKQAITGHGINASTVVTGTMVADFIAGGTLASLNGNLNFDMNIGNFDMENANFTLGNGARINFTSNGNKITYRNYDPESGYSRASGLGVGDRIGGRYPFSYLGTSGSSELDTLSEYFSGFIANTTAAISEGSSNSVSGYRFQFRNQAVEFTKGLELDFNGSSPTIRPINGGLYNYRFGEPAHQFERVYAKEVRATSRVDVRDAYGSGGLLFATDWGGNGTSGTNLGIYGLNPSTYNYNLGRETAPFSYVYTTTLYNQYQHSLSTHSSKMNIEKVDIKIAELYVDTTDVKTFYYKSLEKDNDYINPYLLRAGIILDQLEPSMEYLFKGSKNHVDSNNLPYITQAVLRKTREDFKQYKEDNDLIICELVNEIDSLKEALINEQQ